MIKRYLVVLIFASLVAALTFSVGTPRSTDAAGPIDTSLYNTNDTLVISSIGVNAPVNQRNVGDDGQMGDPAGKDDVVRYDFPTAPGYGGYPGNGGTTVIAGHVDYHPHFEAVFWSLKTLQPGAQIDYYRSDGTVVSYQVSWVSSVGDEDDVAQYLQSTDPESMVLISCEGSIAFDATTGYAHYSSRTVVYAVRVA